MISKPSQKEYSTNFWLSNINNDIFARKESSNNRKGLFKAPNLKHSTFTSMNITPLQNIQAHPIEPKQKLNQELSQNPEITFKSQREYFEISSTNVKRRNCFQDLDYIKKKVKKNRKAFEMETSEGNDGDSMSFSTTTNGSHSFFGFHNEKENRIPKEPINSNSMHPFAAEEQCEKPKKIVKVVYNHMIEKIVFKLQCETKPNILEFKSLTKEEVVNEDPLLLLYFYESQLRFNKATWFKSNTLKQI